MAVKHLSLLLPGVLRLKIQSPTFDQWAQVRILPTNQKPSALGPPDLQMALHSYEVLYLREWHRSQVRASFSILKYSSYLSEPNCRT